jgi:hypothetical protein
MIGLDENISAEHRQRLASWRIRARQIGPDLGRAGMTDENILPLLHELKSVTFFTRDIHYYRRHLCHANYCLVYLDVDNKLTAETLRRFLRHDAFRTWAKRRGKVVRVCLSSMRFWRLHAEREEVAPW